MDLDRKLTRPEATALLREHGFPVHDVTLQQLAHRGNGPAYFRFGKIALYRVGDVLNWANARLKQAA